MVIFCQPNFITLVFDASQLHEYAARMTHKAIGARIKLRRKELNLTQEQLADQANLSQAAIAKIERGGATRHVAEIANALSVSPNWLLSGEQREQIGPAGYWPFKIARLQDFESLPLSKQHELDVRLADFIAGAIDTQRTA